MEKGFIETDQSIYKEDLPLAPVPPSILEL
jgi:hypothetical protein